MILTTHLENYINTMPYASAWGFSFDYNRKKIRPPFGDLYCIKLSKMSLGLDT